MIQRAGLWLSGQVPLSETDLGLLCEKHGTGEEKGEKVSDNCSFTVSFFCLQAGDKSRQALWRCGEINTILLILVAAELSPSTSTGVRVWVHDCPATLRVCSSEIVLFDSPRMKSAPLHDCSDSSWPRIPSQRGRFGAANYPLHRPETTTELVAAAAESTASHKEKARFTKGYFQTVTQSLLKQYKLVQKKEVHKVACEEWHGSRNIKTKQLGKLAKKWRSQNRMKLRTWNKYLVLKQKELETKKQPK